MPFSQARAKRESKFRNVRFLSDYRDGAFGRSTGLLIEGSWFLARAVIVADSEGVVRYLQVVPNMGHLPDMDRAFEEAGRLAGR